MSFPFFLDIHVLSLSSEAAAAACRKIQEGLVASAKGEDRIGQWTQQHQEEGSVVQGHLLRCLWKRKGGGMEDLERVCAPAFVGGCQEPLPHTLAMGVLYGPSLDSVFMVAAGSDGQQEELFTPIEGLEDHLGCSLDLQEIWEREGAAVGEIGVAALPVLLSGSDLFHRFRCAEAEIKMDTALSPGIKEGPGASTFKARF